MNFFCALPKGTEINADGINSFASFGPYYVASRQVGRQIITKTNPNYKGSRPHNVDTFVFTANTNLDQSLLQVKSGQADYDAGGLPPTAHADLAQQFGVNKGPLLRERWSERRLHRDEHDPAGVLERRACGRLRTTRSTARLSSGSAATFAGFRNDQILPPGLGGYKDQKLYPIKGADYAKAKTLASGSEAARTSPCTRATPPSGQKLAQVFKYNLSQIGCNVTVKLFQGFQIYIAAGTKGEPFDAVFAGWFADYADPYDFIDILLNGENIHESNNNNLAYFNNAGVEQADEGSERADRRQAVRRVPGARPQHHQELRSVGGVREPQHARVHLGPHGRLPVPGRPRRANLNTFFIK